MPIPIGWQKVTCYHCGGGRTHYRCTGYHLYGTMLGVQRVEVVCRWILCGECLRHGVTCGSVVHKSVKANEVSSCSDGRELFI